MVNNGRAPASPPAGARRGRARRPRVPGPPRASPGAVRPGRRGGRDRAAEAGRAARELAALHATVSGFPGASELAAFRGNLASQLGFDPLDPEALRDAGFDPGRGAALASLDRAPAGGKEPVRRVVLVLPIRDPPKVEALVQRLAPDRMGATA